MIWFESLASYFAKKLIQHNLCGRAYHEDAVRAFNNTLQSCSVRSRQASQAVVGARAMLYRPWVNGFLGDASY